MGKTIFSCTREKEGEKGEIFSFDFIILQRVEVEEASNMYKKGEICLIEERLWVLLKNLFLRKEDEEGGIWF